MTALNPLAWPVRYARWLHLMWPAGVVEKLPRARPDGTTNVAGLSIVGDLTGVPLLKLSANAGHDAVVRIAGELEGESQQDDVLDLAIVGGGTAGFSAAKEAEKRGLRYCVFEASTPFKTIKDFPKKKPIYTYPTNVEVKGDLDFHEKSDVKEGLVEDLEEQTIGVGLKWVCGQVTQVARSGGNLEIVLDGAAKAPDGVDLNGTSFVTRGERVKAKRVLVAIGRSGNYRELGVPGENNDAKVTHRLHDPADFDGKKVLIVGGGDSAIEAAIALADAGADVTVSYRKAEFNRPKPENQEKIDGLRDDGKVDILFDSNVTEIRDDAVAIDIKDGESKMVDNDQVFLMIGREAPLDFFRRSNVRIHNERTAWWWTSLIAFVLFCVWVYHWKSNKTIPIAGISFTQISESVQIAGFHVLGFLGANPERAVNWVRESLGGYFASEYTLGGVLLNSANNRAFYYTLIYSTIVVVFGIRRIRRRKTPYVFWQTLSLMTFQCIPLFILPELILPWLGINGHMDAGFGGWLNHTFFGDGQGGTGQWWRSYGLILAWPLGVFNWFTTAPIYGWLILGAIQTFVLIPGIVYFWGKGAYCGWICSCGALAETLGDRHREKMPHGPFWNKLNLAGQVILGVAFALMGLRILGWIWPESWADTLFQTAYNAAPFGLNYDWFVDLFLAGIVGYGLYFWFSGRVWCRFFCPLAALMHIYHRFGRFAILAEKKKCISCNVCTSVCHQGIDVMSFANKGRPMVDPQCVRCSACVQMCPTGVLEFGRIDRQGNPSGRDPTWLAASPVRIREGSLGDAVTHGGSSNVAPAPVATKVALTINGRKARKTSEPSPVDRWLGRLGVRA